MVKKTDFYVSFFSFNLMFDNRNKVFIKVSLCLKKYIRSVIVWPFKTFESA